MAYAFLAVAAYQAAQGMVQADLIGEQAQITNRVNELNAQYAELDAYNAEKQGFTASARFQSSIDTVVGQQRVAFASQNVDVSSGTAATVQAETRVTGMLNKIDIEAGARRKAAGFKFEASNRRLGADLALSQSALNQSAAKSQGFGRAVQTGISGFSKNNPPPADFGDSGSSFEAASISSDRGSLVADGFYADGGTKFSYDTGPGRGIFN